MATRTMNAINTMPSFEGAVLRFLSARGFGFIRPFTGGREIFFHISKITDSKELEDLKQGAIVRYRIETTPKGPAAVDIELLKAIV